MRKHITQIYSWLFREYNPWIKRYNLFMYKLSWSQSPHTQQPLVGLSTEKGGIQWKFSLSKGSLSLLTRKDGRGKQHFVVCGLLLWTKTSKSWWARGKRAPRAGHSLGKSLLCCWGFFSDLTHPSQTSSPSGDIPELPGCKWVNCTTLLVACFCCCFSFFTQSQD